MFFTHVMPPRKMPPAWLPSMASELMRTGERAGAPCEAMVMSDQGGIGQVEVSRVSSVSWGHRSGPVVDAKNALKQLALCANYRSILGTHSTPHAQPFFKSHCNDLPKIATPSLLWCLTSNWELRCEDHNIAVEWTLALAVWIEKYSWQGTQLIEM